MMILSEQSLSKLVSNQRILVEELYRRGITISKLSSTNIYQLSGVKTKQYLIGGYTNLIPHNIGLILSNKNFVRLLLLSQKINVAEGKLFIPTDDMGAFTYAKKIKFPIFLRQENAQSEEKGIVVKKQTDFPECFQKLAEFGENILVEKYFLGDSYRVFYTENGFFNMIKRQAFVIEKKGKTDLWKFKKYKDSTSTVHRSFISLSKRVLLCFPQMRYIVFNILCRSIRKPLTKTNYVITEIYPTPGDNLSFEMKKGKIKKKAVEIITHLLFPETIS